MNEAPPKDVASEKPARPLIMVVDDDAETLELCDMLLERAGYDRVLANSGEEAVSLLEAHTPALMVLDLNMPGMDGYEVARRIRGLPGGREATLVALTGWGQESDRRLAIEAGIDHHFTKPADPRTLESLLRSLAARRGLASPS